MPSSLHDRKNLAYLHPILDAAVDGIIVIDSRGIIQSFNRAATQMFGYAPDEVIGRNVSMLMPDPYRRDHDKYMGNYLRTGQAKIIGIGRETAGLRKDGKAFPIRLAVSEVAAGNDRTFLGIVRDISEEKSLEKEILERSEREQGRIAQDLHDGLCQELAGIALRVQTMQQKLQRGQAVNVDETTDEITTLLQDAVRHARELSRSLYPVGPQPNSLANALLHLAENTTDLRNVKCTFLCPQPIQIGDASIATHLYRIAQEAVREAIERGHAKQIALKLLDANDTVELSIADDGLKLSEDGRFNGEMVLRMIEHRARAIGAQLHIQTQTHGGVIVTCNLPRSEPAAD